MNKSLTATLKYATLSCRKLSVVATMIQWMPVQEALILLQFLPKKGADVLWKLVKAASSNAENNLNIGASDLIVKEIKIGRWPRIKRVRAVWRGRMHGYEKHRSYVSVVLDTTPTV